jgi:hypothetical protein
MPEFHVPVVYTFDGVFKVNAKDAQEATKIVQCHCGMIAGDISSTLSEKDVDWEFGVHPEQSVGTPLKA